MGRRARPQVQGSLREARWTPRSQRVQYSLHPASRWEENSLRRARPQVQGSLREAAKPKGAVLVASGIAMGGELIETGRAAGAGLVERGSEAVETAKARAAQGL